MNNTSDFNEKDSLILITSMINKAKGNLGDNSIYFLLWGWAVLIASLSHFALLQLEYENHWLPWMLMPITGVVSGIIGAKKSKKQKDHGFVSSAIGYVWAAFVVTMLIVLVNGYKMGWENAYPVLISLYGLATFITGGLVKFKPFVYGGVSAWIISVISFYVPFEFVVLLIGLSMITAYLIPGYMFKRAYAKQA